MVIAIDGPAVAGKSTVARAVANALGFAYLDTGAMYRCVGLLSLQQPGRDLAQLAQAAHIDIGEHVRLDGRDVDEEIRAPSVAGAASRVAADPDVREELVAKQRALLARGGDWVVEGRDIATAVAPDAELKVFLTAGADERARRRAAELGVDQALVLEQLAERDLRDSTREHSPLAPAPGAVVLDTSELGADDVARRVLSLARAILER